MKKIVIIYHRNCSDGFGAAWVAWKKFGNQAEYITATHPSSPPKNLKGKEVYMLDFCYSAKEMQAVLREVLKLTVIDHHISQKNAIKFSTNYVFNTSNSGAVLAWKYFFPGQKTPKLLLYIEDKDIWKWSLKGTQEYFAFLETHNFDFKVWDKLIKDFADTTKRKSFYGLGAAITSFNNQQIDALASSAESVIFDNRKCLAVNSPLFISEIGHILALKIKGVGIVWCKKGNKLKISMRSNGKIDVAKIATKKGGGGHRSAASFSLDITDSIIKLPWKRAAK